MVCWRRDRHIPQSYLFYDANPKVLHPLSSLQILQYVGDTTDIYLSLTCSIMQTRRCSSRSALCLFSNMLATRPTYPSVLTVLWCKPEGAPAAQLFAYSPICWRRDRSSSRRPTRPHFGSGGKPWRPEQRNKGPTNHNGNQVVGNNGWNITKGVTENNGRNITKGITFFFFRNKQHEKY